MTPQAQGSVPEDARHKKPALAYDLLNELAATGKPYSDEDMIAKTGWKESTVRTYRNKHWSDWIKKNQEGFLTVSPSFRNVSREDFISIHIQSTEYYSRYNRSIYGTVVKYEFLLPLTKERELTRALDNLFYKDAIIRIIHEDGLDFFKSTFPEIIQSDESSALNTILNFVDDHFGGYSISHVIGRFRADNLISRKEASDKAFTGESYLMNETTAIVRFIVPLKKAVNYYKSDGRFLDAVVADEKDERLTQEICKELAQVRQTFFVLFAEAVVKTVKGEDEVWLLESGPEDRLYVWEKA